MQRHKMCMPVLGAVAALVAAAPALAQMQKVGASPEASNMRLVGLSATHKNWWECDTGIAYLVSGAPGWRTRRMTQVYDLSDPAHPVKIRDFGLPGQEPGTSGTVPAELHGPISIGPEGNRVYF